MSIVVVDIRLTRVTIKRFEERKERRNTKEDYEKKLEK